MKARFSGGGGDMQKSRRMRTRRSRPPSVSHIRGEVEVSWVRWVKELRSGSGDVLSRASRGQECAHQTANNEHKRREKGRTSSVVQLQGDAYARSVLGGEGKVGLAHRVGGPTSPPLASSSFGHGAWSVTRVICRDAECSFRTQISEAAQLFIILNCRCNKISIFRRHNASL